MNFMKKKMDVDKEFSSYRLNLLTKNKGKIWKENH